MRHMRLPLVSFLVVSAPVLAQTTVFSSDFDAALPAAIAPGTAILTGVQGFAALGPVASQFGGTFLRSETGNTVTLQLNNLPAHNSIRLDFLFAAIDSLDGQGTFPSGDFFKITLDGATIFRESFANALPSQIQTYVPTPGVELARRVDLGFGGPGSFYTDSAYWLGGDPRFSNLGHTASTATFQFVIEGPGIQPLSDESWAMDNLNVSVSTTTFPGSAVPYGTGCGPVLAATATPRLGETLPLLATGLAPNSVLAACVVGASDLVYQSIPLPRALDAFGMPGCFQLHDLMLGTISMPMVGTAAFAAPLVPQDAVLLGGVMYMQVWEAAPAVNALGFVASNGLRVTIGN